jgi:hypothetical protein
LVSRQDRSSVAGVARTRSSAYVYAVTHAAAPVHVIGGGLAGSNPAYG